MKNRLSYEYAEALFLLSCEKKEEEQYLNDLRLVKGVFDSEPDYIKLLSSPGIKINEKHTAIDNAFCGRINDDIVSFLKLLCDNNRMNMIYSCFEDYEKLYNQVKRVIVAEVESVRELSENEKEQLVANLERKFKHRVELSCHINRDLIGGIIVRTDDLIIDGSLRRKLRDVKEVISSEPKT